MSIGANIRKRRFELKMSQQELADAMGYKSRTTIAKIESGENDVTQSKLQKFAKILYTTVQNLMLGNDSINLPTDYYIEPFAMDGTTARNKNVAIIMAGGKSSRNNQNIPNQFINVLGKPVIVYCLEAYQQHPAIDDIYIVCLKGWESIVIDYARQFNITKLRSVIPAGPSGIMSVKNGLDHIEDKYSNDDIIIIQESTRPMVTTDMISKLIQTVKSIGSANICKPMRDHVIFSVTDSSISYVNRDTAVELQSPEAFKLNILKNAFRKAEKNNHILTESCCAMLMYNMGYYINFIEGPANNLKIIRQEDIAVFASVLKNSSNLPLL